MSTNKEMVATMAQRGYANDQQCTLRGIRSRCTDAELWIAVKEEQNLVLDEDGSWKLWYRHTPDGDGTLAQYDKGVRFIQHAPGTRRLTVWMKKRRTKKWHELGLYEFEAPYDEVHHVIKRGKPHTTTKVRRAVRV